MRLGLQLRKIKWISDQGFLLRVRSRLLHWGVQLSNFDRLLALPFKSSLQLSASAPPSPKKKIAILSSYRPIFWHGNIFETQLVKALEKEGYEPIHILCHGFMETCDAQFFKSNKDNNPIVCQDCVLRNKLYHTTNNSKHMFIDPYVDWTEVEKIRPQINAITDVQDAIAFTYKSLPIGKWCHLSVCRYFLRLTLDQPEHLKTFKKFLISSITLNTAFTKIFQRFDFQNFVFFNGAYPSWRIPLETVRAAGKDFWSYEFSERERIFFVHNEISVKWADVNEKFYPWLESLSPEMEKTVREAVPKILEGRRKNFLSTIINIHDTIQADKPIDLAIFTNVVWDSAVFGRDTIFKSQFDWLRKMIKWVEAHPQFNVVLRVHPGEQSVVWNVTQERVHDVINKEFPLLPKNLTLYSAEDRRNSYDLVAKAKLTAVYTSSIGLEAALMNKPVIIASWSHYSRPNLTIAPTSEEAYFNNLLQLLNSPADTLPKPKDMAEKYTYWYFEHYHRLNNTDLHKGSYAIPDDSWYLRVPKIIPTKSSEFKALVKEFVATCADKKSAAISDKKREQASDANL